MRKSHAIVLRAFSIWTTYVWTTRMWNIWRDRTRSTGFKTVHSVLAGISIAFALACWVIVSRNRSQTK